MRKKVDIQDKMVGMMETGHYTPLQGYRHLKNNYNQMSDCERTTDSCRAMIALEEVDATDFADRL